MHDFEVAPGVTSKSRDLVRNILFGTRHGLHNDRHILAAGGDNLGDRSCVRRQTEIQSEGTNYDRCHTAAIAVVPAQSQVRCHCFPRLFEFILQAGPLGLLRDTAFKQAHDNKATAVFDLSQISR